MTKSKRMRWCVGLLVVSVLGLAGGFAFLLLYAPPIPANHGKVNAQLYLGERPAQPLVVAFGGGEGGNAWTSDRWAEVRGQFLAEGYAFLAVGYFGMEETPSALDRISLNAIHDKIIEAAEEPLIDGSKIAVIGGSKGGELALNLASRYDDIDAVVAMVPSSVSFPALTPYANTSSWMFNGNEVPFVAAPLATAIPLIKGDIFGFHSMTLDASTSYPEATIEVEKINGPILLISASADEMWPSQRMCHQIEDRLSKAAFIQAVEHIEIQGSHADAANCFDDVLEFLRNHFATGDNVQADVDRCAAGPGGSRRAALVSARGRAASVEFTWPAPTFRPSQQPRLGLPEVQVLQSHRAWD